MRRPVLLPALLALAVAGVPFVMVPAQAAPAVGLNVFAGSGAAAASGDGGPAVKAQLDSPSGIAVAADGTVYISDTGNHTVRAVAPGGTIRTVAGTGKVPPTAAVHDGVPGTQLDLASPADLAVGPDRSLYIADIGLFRVFRLAPDGRITLVAGDGVRGYTGDGGSATEAEIGAPAGLAVGSDGTVYFGDPDNQRVRAVTPNGAIATAAGNGNAQLDAAGGPAAGVAVPAAASLSPDQTGNVWMVDSGYLRRFGGGHLATVTEPGEPAGQRWGISDATKWPPPETPLSNVGTVAVDGTTVYVLTTAGLQRLDVGQRLETVAGVGDHVFGPIAAAAGAVYLVDRTGNQVYVTRPTRPPAAAPGSRSSTPWWPFVAGGAAVVLLIVVIFWVRRGRRPVR